MFRCAPRLPVKSNAPILPRARTSRRATALHPGPPSISGPLDQLQANLARDQAQLANARAQAERNEKLFQAGIISKDQYDTFRTTAQAQEATVRAGQAAIENARK
jgi:hypothetical protein